MLEVIFKLGCSLDASIPHLTYLDRVETIPSPTMEFLIEVRQKLAADKVEKCITNITVALPLETVYIVVDG